MSRYWLVIMLTSIGSVRLQFINTGETGFNSAAESSEPNSYRSFYSTYLNLANSENDFEAFKSQPGNLDMNQFYHRDDGEQSPPLQRKRRTSEHDPGYQRDVKPWVPNSIDLDKTWYLRSEDAVKAAPFIIQKLEHMSDSLNMNASNGDNIERLDKKSFSPWGGKRGNRIENGNLWTWKRNANIREPTMPKRVRFSPWGGKRSGQLVFKPGNKASKIIFSNTIPELTRFISSNSPGDEIFNLARFRVIPAMDKRHPIRVLALSAILKDKNYLPLNAFIETSEIFKPGHTYVDVNLKKDGKRKVKFSAWGGKRSPPIIGPIWTPPAESRKDDTLNAVLLVRDNSGDNAKSTKAM